MKDYDYVPFEHEKEDDPLKATHNIAPLVSRVKQFTRGLDLLGMSCSNDIDFLLDEIVSFANDASSGIIKETNDRFKDAQQSTANMLNGVLAGIKIAKDDQEA